jgi:hypothetical protein
MSLQPSQSNRSNGTEDLKVWNCINCRRRKVRCDRHFPCAPCIKNKAECVFPVAGRIPRRSRNANFPKPPAQNQTELLGGLRRLEAMVGDLTSQVENAAKEKPHSTDSSTVTTSTTGAVSNETGLIENRHISRNQSTGGNSNEMSTDSSGGNLDLPQISNESADLLVASNGDIVVGDRFWTIFCKEVCFGSVFLS